MDIAQVVVLVRLFGSATGFSRVIHIGPLGFISTSVRELSVVKEAERGNSGCSCTKVIDGYQFELREIATK